MRRFRGDLILQDVAKNGIGAATANLFAHEGAQVIAWDLPPVIEYDRLFFYTLWVGVLFGALIRDIAK